jgi:hypothetical protein
MRFAALFGPAFASALLCCAGAALAGDATPAPIPSPADCSAVGVADASRILGFAVVGPDADSRAGGICFFASRAISEDGSVSYAIVTDAQLPQRRGFFGALARRCGSVAHGAPRELICKAYVDLALAKDLDAYFAARTSFADASPLPDLDATAIATADALYLRRPHAVLEVAVSRGGDFDLERSTELAKLLLARLKP